MIVAVAFSKVYLGRHFIGDVLGGVILGLIFLVILSHFLKSSLKEDFFKKESFELAFRRQNLFFYCFMFLIPFIFTALSIVDANVSGLFLGTNVAYLLIISKGLPEDIGNVAQRATRVFIAFLLFGITFIIFDFWFKTAGTPNYLHFTIEFMKTFIPAITIWVSVAICKKFDLYRRDKEGPVAKIIRSLVVLKNFILTHERLIRLFYAVSVDILL